MSKSQEPALPPGWQAEGWRIERFGDLTCFVFDGRENIQTIRDYYRNRHLSVLDSIIEWFKRRV